jgi:hypothetical protein
MSHRITPKTTDRSGSSSLVGRCRRVILAVRPACLRVDPHLTRTLALAPRAGHRARLSPKVGSDLPRTPTGHTLLRPVGPLCLIAVVVLLASHEARLALHA